MANKQTILDLAAALVAQLSAAGRVVATAESCTGGWIAKSLTDVAGSSAVLGYGVVSYSNGAKEKMLGVSNETLLECGAVSEDIVVQMAEGVLNLSGADISVAVSGVAGPDGGTDDKPVGTVWFAWARRNDSGFLIDTDQQCFDGDRNDVRSQTVVHALIGISDRVNQ